MRTCQRCGAARDGVARYCAACGLDFWQAAADEANPRPVEPPAPAPAQRGGRRRVAAVAVGVGLVLLVAAGVGTVAMVGMGFIGRSEPTPAIRQLTAEDEVVNAFFRQARDPDASFAVVQDAVVNFSDNAGLAPMVASATGRIQGDDWSATVSITQAPTFEFTGDIALVDGTAYARAAGLDWVVDEAPGSALSSVNPFAPISTVGELEYVGAEERDGESLHRLMTEKWLGHETVAALEGIARVSSRESRMDVYVDADGVPRSATYTFSLEATNGTDSLTVSGTSTYAFSEWGSVAPIEAPIPAS